MIRLSRFFKKFTITAADEDSVRAFLEILLLGILKNRGEDVRSFKSTLDDLHERAKQFTEQLNLKRTISSLLDELESKHPLEDEYLTEIASRLKKNKAEYVEDVTMPKYHDYVGYLNTLTTYMGKKTDPSWLNVVNKVGLIGNNKLTQAFGKFVHVRGQQAEKIETGNLKEAKATMKEAVKQFLHRTGYFIHPLEIPKLIENDPDIKEDPLYQKYLKAQSLVNALVKLEQKKFVRASGKQLLPVEDVREHLDSIGLPNDLPTGVKGLLMDENGGNYLADGSMLVAHGSIKKPIVLIGPMEMNRAFDPKLHHTYAISKVGGKKAFVYTKQYVMRNRQELYNNTLKFIKNDKEHRASWITYLNGDGTLKQVYAAMLELLYHLAMRPGSKESIDDRSEEDATYALTVLQVGHMKIGSNSVIFEYKGKKGVQQKHIYNLDTPEAKKVASILKTLVKGKGPKDFLFTYRGSRITEQSLREFARVDLKIPIKLHGFRKVKATKIFIQLISKSPFKPENTTIKDRSKVEAWVKKEVELAATALGHYTHTGTPNVATTLKYYIEPGVIKSFFQKLHLPVPTWVSDTGVLGEDADTIEAPDSTYEEPSDGDVPPPTVKKRGGVVEVGKVKAPVNTKGKNVTIVGTTKGELKPVQEKLSVKVRPQIPDKPLRPQGQTIGVVRTDTRPKLTVNVPSKIVQEPTEEPLPKPSIKPTVPSTGPVLKRNPQPIKPVEEPVDQEDQEDEPLKPIERKERNTSRLVRLQDEDQEQEDTEDEPILKPVKGGNKSVNIVPPKKHIEPEQEPEEEEEEEPEDKELDFEEEEPTDDDLRDIEDQFGFNDED